MEQENLEKQKLKNEDLESEILVDENNYSNKALEIARSLEEINEEINEEVNEEIN